MKSSHCSSSRPCLLLTFAVLIGTAGHALAFNASGHMLVADIAFAQMLAAALAGSAVAKKTIKAIRGILSKAKSGFEPGGQSDVQLRDAFAYAATFPDVIKSSRDTAYEDLVLAMNPIFWKNGTPPKGAGNEGERCRSWHFFDTPLNVAPGAKPKNWESNLKVAWAKAIACVKDGANPSAETSFNSDDLKFWWLAWILHQCGDAHQPLHCAENYNGTNKGDSGGNGFKLDRGRSLHTIWDAILTTAASQDGMPISSVEHGNSSFTLKLKPVSESWIKAYAPPASTANNLDISAWVADGAVNAEKIVYKNIAPGVAPTEKYMKAALAFAHKTAVLGGCRLANQLQLIFGHEAGENK